MRGYALIEADAGPSFSLYLAVRAVLSGRRVLYLDAVNSFNPYALTRLLHRHRLDRSLLGRVLISRAFTCHQLEALVREEVGAAVRRHRVDTIIVSDMGALLYDEDVELPEALRVTLSISRRLAALPRPRVIMAPPRPGREPVFARVREHAARVLRTSDDFKVLSWDGPFRPLPSFSTPR